MKVLVLHDGAAAAGRPDEVDALVQSETVCNALHELGHEPAIAPVTADLAPLRRRLAGDRPDLVFNLVEALGGRGELIHFVPALVESLGIACTGCPAWAVFTTSGKLYAKHILRLAGLPTPDWHSRGDLAAPLPPAVAAGTYIVKSVWEHASVGLDDDAVIEAADAAALAAAVEALMPRFGLDAFAERYIDGREFNLSLLEGPGGPEVLPPAEILFEGYGEDRPRIVGYKAKWDEQSFECHHTPRRFDFAQTERALLEELRALALRCWSVFGLRGYARVDFRVDGSGRPWVLEINTNPCLSPDAGFAAAAERAGLTVAAAIERIVDAALRLVPQTHRP